MRQLSQRDRQNILEGLQLLKKQKEEHLKILTAPVDYPVSRLQAELKEVQSVIETLKSDEEVIW